MGNSTDEWAVVYQTPSLFLNMEPGTVHFLGLEVAILYSNMFSGDHIDSGFFKAYLEIRETVIKCLYVNGT